MADEDIVGMLRRTPASVQIEYPIPEAADEIERLRSVVADLREQVHAAFVNSAGKIHGVATMAGILAWARFGAAIMEAGRGSGIGDIHGEDLQDIGVRTGVLVATEATGPCGESCRCAEYGGFPVTCYRQIAAPSFHHKE